MSELPQENSKAPSTSAAADHGRSTTAAASTQRQTQLREIFPPPPPPPVPRPVRSASFSNILNPDDGTQRRRKVPQLGSPSTTAAQVSSLIRHGRQSPVLSGPSGAHLEHRRILTPRSPSLHRAASMSHFSNPTSSIDAQQPPFSQLRAYTAEPGTAGVPPLPTSRGYPLPPRSPSSAIDRRTSASTQDLKARSPSVSPRTSYVPQYGSLRSSPSATTLPSLSAIPYSADHALDRQRPVGIPISSAAGQNVYQMMTLQTTAGAVQVPVDVQAASRVADEKRRRNAGASARFRARRKEKEKESSSTIAKLEMQLKDLSEDVDFYRRERGYLAGIVLQVPGGDRHFPRPQSPRHRRVSMQRSTSGSGDYMSGPEMSRSPGDGRSVRRRTPSMPLPAVASASSYAPQHYEHPQYAAPQQALPGPASLLPPIHAHPGTAPGTTWSAYNAAEQQNRPSDPHTR